MSVLLLAGASDPQGKRVRASLRDLGVDTIPFDAGAYPERGLLSIDGRSIRLGRKVLPDIHAVYIRGLGIHPLTPGFEEDLALRPQGLIAQCDEKRALLESLLLELETRGARLVNSLEANAQHARKPLQLRRLQAAGVPVPRWIATNNAAEVRRFTRDVGEVVYKPLSGGATVRRLSALDLSPDRLDALKVAPVLFQEFVEGVSVRAYVVGRKVVAAAEIHSPELDYRRDTTAVMPTRLTSAERRACLTAAKACGMRFTGVDLIRGAEDFALLECNPSPMFAAFERATGFDIAGPLARLLSAT